VDLTTLCESKTVSKIQITKTILPLAPLAVCIPVFNREYVTNAHKSDKTQNSTMSE